MSKHRAYDGSEPFEDWKARDDDHKRENGVEARGPASSDQKPKDGDGVAVPTVQRPSRVGERD